MLLYVNSLMTSVIFKCILSLVNSDYEIFENYKAILKFIFFMTDGIILVLIMSHCNETLLSQKKMI